MILTMTISLPTKTNFKCARISINRLRRIVAGIDSEYNVSSFMILNSLPLMKISKKMPSEDLFHDGGVIKSIVRPSNDNARPKRGDEVALVFTFISESEPHSQNLVYVVGTSSSNLFLPLRTLDRIVCEMRRNEKCQVKIDPRYSNRSDVVEVEITLLSIKLASSNQSGGLQSLSGNLGEFQAHLGRNPDVMEQMMSSPQMQSLLSNPETMRSLLGMNPQMQELMQQNPELNNMLNDPDFLQQTMEAMRNPNMMREMMRSTDRAMSNIESLPGGSAALHKLYNEVQAPLFEATQASTSDVKKVNDEKQLKAKYGELVKPDKPISAPLSNPWASPIPHKIPAPIVPQARSAPLDMSAMGHMMRDPGLQQLMTAMARSNNVPQPTATGGSAVNPVANQATLQHLFDPTTMQAIGRLEQSLASLQGRSELNAGIPLNPPDGFNHLFSNLLSTSAVDPEERYRTQLAALRDMGFTDTRAIIRALEETNGDVDEAAVKLASQLEELESEHKNNL